MNDTVVELMVLKAFGTIDCTNIHRVFFILKEKHKIPLSSVNFRILFYGPYSEDLVYDMAALEAFGYVEVNRAYMHYDYSLSQMGAELVRSYLEGKKGRSLFRKIEESVKELRGMSPEELLREARTIWADKRERKRG